MYDTLVRLLKIAQAVLVAVALALAAGMWHLSYRLQGAIVWVERTHDVIHQVDLVRISALRNSVWLTNFLKSGARRQLLQAEQSADNGLRAAQRIVELTADRGDDHALALALQRDLQLTLADYRDIGRLAQAEGREVAQAVMVARAAQDPTRGLRGLLDEMQASMLRQLRIGVGAQADQLAALRVALGVGVVSLLAAALALHFMTRRLLSGARAAQRRLTRQASQDFLTGLLNRRELTDQVTRLVARGDGSGERRGPGALLLFDLDDFKPINDRLGHEAGDRVLQVIGQRLQQQCREGDLVGRLGGDEFVVLLGDADNPALAHEVARRVCGALLAPIGGVNGQTVSVSASVGVAMIPADGRDIESLLRVADARLYEAKRASKDEAQEAAQAAAIMRSSQAL